jgi:hemerythrin-like metal-binding domain
MLAWEDEYRTGIEEIDAEHVTLLALLNQLGAHIATSRTGEGLEDVLNALATSLDWHFAHEETLMRSWSYPGLEEHAARHREFETGFSRLRGGNPGVAAVTLREFVLAWLLDHMAADAAYAAFVTGRRKG